MPDRAAVCFSLSVWVVMLATGLTLVAIYGSNMPAWDDWDIVPTATGHRPVTAEWLWSQHNEHRVPLPRLLLLGIMRWIAMDFRAGMYFNVLTTGVVALGMIFAARRLRGTSSFLDAFFPIALMNWGQAMNLLWCWQVQYSASILPAAAVLLVITRTETPPKPLPTLIAGVSIVLLPLCGANGLGLVPALTIWLGYIAILQWRTATSIGRGCAVMAAAFAVTALLLVGLYFVGYDRMPYFYLTHSLRLIARNAAQFLTIGFGPGVVGLSFDGRVPMFFWKFVCAAVVGLFAVTCWVLVTTWWKQPNQRARAAGLFLFLAAMMSLALGLGIGRAAFETRYVTLSVPGLCAVYLAWTIYGSPRLQNLVRTTLFVTVVVVLAPNTFWGWQWAHYIKSHLEAFERDIIGGMPPYRLLQRHADLHQDNELMMDYMPMLRGAGVGAFRYLRNDPPFREIALPLVPVDMHDMQWQDGVARATERKAWLTFMLPGDVEAAGIRLDYTYSNPDDVEPYLGISWKSSKETDFADDSHLGYYPIGDRANWRHGTWARLNDKITSLHVWVSHPIQAARLYAHETATIEIHRLTLLVPAERDPPD
jgi:hypothetical protein